MKQFENKLKSLDKMGYEYWVDEIFHEVKIMLKGDYKYYVISMSFYDMEQDFIVEEIVHAFNRMVKRDMGK